MPKLHNIEKLTPNLSIGVQVGKGTQDIVSKGVWTARIKFSGQIAKFRSTKVKYGGGNEELKKQAIKRAYELLQPETEVYASGGDINKVYYAKRLLLNWEDFVIASVEDFEAYGTTTDIAGGRGHWTKPKWIKLKNNNIYLNAFLRSLDTSREESRRIESITKREWDTYDNWLQRNAIKYSPRRKALSVESRLRQITALRLFLSWCYEKEYIEDIPSIKRPSRGGVRGARERKRREILPEDYKNIVKYTREKYLEGGDIYQGYRDYQYLFHLWIMILANTGIRPPTGGTKHTLMKWGHVDFSDPERPLLLRPDEKLHTYAAIIMPNAVTYINELRTFYEEQRGMPCTKDDYIFRHTCDRKTAFGRWEVRKGDPVYSFRGQWVNMVETLGLAKKGDLQSERVSPSSLRAWFITSRLYADERVDILQLARATGTSVGQIEERYARLDTRRSYDWLSAGGHLSEGERKYEIINGTTYYVGHEKVE